MTSYPFRRNPMVCAVTPDPTGAALPVKYGPWDRAEAPWDGRHAGLVADIRGLLEDRAAGNCG
jgi:hypothetical protein